MKNKHLYINLYINLNSFIKFNVPCFQENLSRKPVGQILRNIRDFHLLNTLPHFYSCYSFVIVFF